MAVVLAGVCPAVASEPSASLDRGYRFMYNLDFQSARQEFARWQQEKPNDALGPVSEAANWLFSEFHRLGTLESEFFVKDSEFKSRQKLKPDPVVRARFEEALQRAEALGRERVTRDPKDRDALFALTLVYGLRADYAALIEKRNMASLGYTREASERATKLLEIAPDYYDAYLATGMSNYIIGSLAAPLRWLLRLGGYSGDKEAGIRDLKLTAERGRFLAPFARLLLAVAYLRANNRPEARQLLAGLHNEFPSNSLFTLELARLDAGRK